MEKKIVLTGIARSKGKAKAEAMVFSHRFGWAFNHVGNEDGKILTAGWDNLGQSVTGKVVVYPTVTGSTSGAVSLYYKVKQSQARPRGHHLPGGLPLRYQRRHCCRDSGRGQVGPGPDHDHQDRRHG